jgi:hypothetical protein
MVRIELPAPVGAEALAVEAPAVEAPASATAAGSALHLANELGRAN